MGFSTQNIFFSISPWLGLSGKSFPIYILQEKSCSRPKKSFWKLSITKKVRLTVRWLTVRGVRSPCFSMVNPLKHELFITFLWITRLATTVFCGVPTIYVVIEKPHGENHFQGIFNLFFLICALWLLGWLYDDFCYWSRQPDYVIQVIYNHNTNKSSIK